MRLFSKILTMLLSACMICTLVSCNKEEPPAAPEGDGDAPVTEKEIDIYLVAGQSNAVGHTKIDDASKIYAAAPVLDGGVPHVHYAGNSRSDGNGAAKNFEKDWQKTTLNLGMKVGYMGPEVGMAAALSAYYNPESGKHAGIIKFAHGGTSLLNKNSGSNAFGNWVSPSYAESLGVTWNDTDKAGETEVVGGLYRGLLNEVYQRVGELKEYGGFTKINIKGIYWMQGCNNRYDHKNNPNAYPEAFGLFVQDLRQDLAQMMTQTFGSPCGANTMKVFVGTLSNTFMLDGETTEEQINKPFIEMQKKLPENISGCYVVDNSAYAISKWENGGRVKVEGSPDGAHWGQDNMFAIGKNVGNKILEVCTK